MRKHRLLISTLLFIGTLSITSCSFLSDLMKDTETEEKGEQCEHEFGENKPVSGSDATCQKKGKVKRTCTKCGKTETITDYLPHTPLNSNVYNHDDHYHYQNCKWCDTILNKEEHDIKEEVLVQYDCTKEGECRFYCDKCDYSHVDIHPAEHYYPVHSHTDATCLADGLETYDPCPGCGNIKEDHIIPKIDHHYIGEVCEYCERDVMLDYLDKFENHGDSQSDRIELYSEQEYLSLWNYVTIYRHPGKYFELKYDIEDWLGMKNYFERTIELITAPNFIHGFSFGSDMSIKKGTMRVPAEDLEDVYTRASGVDYPENIKPEYENPIDEVVVKKGNRNSSFDNFKIYNRINELEVSNSDQLTYACSHGYKPKVVPGSSAETVLNEIKSILREIVDDSMSDVQKLYNIYSWIVKNVQYDDGAVEYTDNGTYEYTQLKAWAVEGTIFEHKSICDSMSKAFVVFAGMEDIRCIQVSGNKHAWNRVYLDLDNTGEYKWYVIDATFANSSSGEHESANHYNFLNSDATKTKEDKKTADNYLDCVASNHVNPYKYIHYGNATPSSSNDLFIENDAELEAYYSYISSSVKSLHSAGKDVIIETCYSTSYSPANKTFQDLCKKYFNWNITTTRFTEKAYTGYQIWSYMYAAS